MSQPSPAAQPLTFRRYRELLMQAYGDFVHSNAQREKVFKVFQEATGEKTVTLQSLKASLPSQGGSVPAYEVPAHPQAQAAQQQQTFSRAV